MSKLHEVSYVDWWRVAAAAAADDDDDDESTAVGVVVVNVALGSTMPERSMFLRPLSDLSFLVFFSRNLHDKSSRVMATFLLPVLQLLAVSVDVAFVVCDLLFLKTRSSIFLVVVVVVVTVVVGVDALFSVNDLRDNICLFITSFLFVYC